MQAETEGIAWLCGKILEWESLPKWVVQEEFVSSLKCCSSEETETNLDSDLLKLGLLKMKAPDCH